MGKYAVRKYNWWRMVSEDGSPEVEDKAAFDPRRCREMGFGELREFIDGCLDGLPDSASDPALPGSKEEFLYLADMLGEMATATAPTPPEPPTLEYPVREPTEKLASARSNHKSLRNDIENAWNDPSSTRERIGRLERQLKGLEREMGEMEAAEGREYEKRLDAFRGSRLAHEQAMREWGAEADEARKARETARRRAEIVERVRRSIERAFEPQPTGRFQWRPLARKDATPADIHWHYRERLHHEGRLDKFNQERLDEATNLPYSDWWVPTEGFGGFDAYSIFSFDDTQKVLLECPLYGNAAYVIDSGEESWKDKTKQELVESGRAEKIAHRGEDWPAKIRQALDLE